MHVTDFIRIVNSDFYCGVPDSKLRALCDYLFQTYGVDGPHHIVAANEGNCVGIAAGYHLATGKVPVVYLQNSGEGNIVNPYASLLHKDVYGIPVIFVIGWRGEPGVPDEPQHAFQGKITASLLDQLSISYLVIDNRTTPADVEKTMRDFEEKLAGGESVAFIVKKDGLEYESVRYPKQDNLPLNREEVLRHIAEAAGKDILVATTGKTGRELFEIREQNGQGHEKDFLTVGSMGHALAYNLFNWFRRLVLPASLNRKRIDTIRLKLLKVAAKVVHQARYIVFKLCSSYPYKKEFYETIFNIWRLQPQLE